MKRNIVMIAITAVLLLTFTAVAGAQDDTAWVQLQYSTTDFQYDTNDTLVVEAWMKSTVDLRASSTSFIMNRPLFDVDSAYWSGNVTVTVDQLQLKADTIIMGAVVFSPAVFFTATTDYTLVCTFEMIYKASELDLIDDSTVQFFLDSAFIPPATEFIFTDADGNTVRPIFENDTIYLHRRDITDINPGVIPAKFELGQNYPNPFNPTTNIEFAVPVRSNVKLSVYNVMGQKVRTLVNEELDAGWKMVTWDGKSDSGNEVGSGVYLYRVEAGDFIESKKMTLVK
ncbi:MAG: T9SS type A sorting domain-containing protein [candidate division Zixibacteria bacterium]|nr:T9SS type A sorting domain-containing protein [candidate division Zixibacteria bacterium]